MQVIVQPIGPQSDFRLLEEACLTLNILQTLWQFKVQIAIPRPPQNGLGPERFKLSLALEIIPSIEEGDAVSKDLIVGAFSGRVDLKGFFLAYNLEYRKGIISEYDWNDRPPSHHRALWTLSLVNLALRHYIGSGCSNDACIGCCPLNTKDLNKTLATLSFCPMCRERLSLLEPYRLEEIDRLFSWIKVNALNEYAPEELLAFSKPSLPVLETQITRQKTKGNSHLFSRYGILLIMHFLDDLIPFIDALKSLGARDESICLLVKPYPYGNRAGVGGYLSFHYKNVKTIYLPFLPPAEGYMKEAVEFCRQKSQNNRILVIEDGGYIVPFIYKQYPDYPDFCIGAVEQTTKGIRRDEKLIDLKIPVINVAKSKFKDRVEAPLVGKSIVFNLQRILEPLGIHLQGRKAGVVGYGAIGKEVAQSLRDLGMEVHVTDTDLSALCEAGIRGYNLEKKTEELVKGAFLIVGTTGGTRKENELVPTISGDALRNLSPGAILVSASSDQIEIDLAELKSMAETRRHQGLGTWYTVKRTGGVHEYLVIGDGYPINFFRGQGIPNESIDPILTQLLLGAIHLATSKSSEKGIIEGVADKLLEENKVIEDLLYAHFLLH